MKKKIIIAVSVILVIAALITSWVFWKMSKNPDKNAVKDPSVTLSDVDYNYSL